MFEFGAQTESSVIKKLFKTPWWCFI